MPSPPRNIFLPLASQPSQPAWARRLEQLRDEMVGRVLSPERRQSLDAWLEREFVSSALRLSGVSSATDRVDEILSGDTTGAAPFNIRNKEVRKAVACLRAVQKEVDTRGAEARLTPELLGELVSVAATNAGAEGDIETTSQVAGASLRDRLRLLSDWAGADSFLELHPVEQASVVLLRLVELTQFIDSRINQSNAEAPSINAAALAAASLPVSDLHRVFLLKP